MKKVLFVNDELSVGGVSTVLLNLLNALDKKEYEIHLLILNRHEQNYDHLPPYIKLVETTTFFDVCDIPIQECFKMGPIYLFKKIYFYLLIKTGLINKRLKKERLKMNIDDYDTEIAFKEGISSIFVANSSCQNIINWVHSDYRVMNYSKHYIKTMTKTLSKFNMNVAVSKVAMESFKEIFKIENIKVIHNVLNVEDIKWKMEEPITKEEYDGIRLISVGRLHPQKSYDRLLNVAKRLNDEGYKFQLDIIGDGILKENLKKQKEELNLNNINFLLEKSNPFPYVKRSDLFVLSSIYEGLPTVVYESLICGVPVISTRVAGVDEQLDEKIGMIVDNDEDSLFKGLKLLFENPEKIRTMKNNLSAYNYENDYILSEVGELLNNER